jgi:hypothetical protein
MFGKAKVSVFNYIIAVKDYNNTLRAIEEGSLYVHFSKDIYSKLFQSQVAKLDNLKELKKFIRFSQREKSEVAHYWETLVTGGYTLLAIKYDEKNPSLEKICESSGIKIVSTG